MPQSASLAARATLAAVSLMAALVAMAPPLAAAAAAPAVADLCAGVVCPPASGPCKAAGVCSASTGSCAPETAQADGTSCGTNKACLSGACTAVCSSSPDNPLHGAFAACGGVLGLAPLGRVCKATCYSGFRGTVSARCGAGGWSASKGSCEPVVCPGNPPNPLNGQFACGLTTPANMTCNATCTAPGFKGLPTAVCQPTGRWGPVHGACRKASTTGCKGNPTPNPPNGAFKCAANTALGRSCSASCSLGYGAGPSGAPVAKCTAPGTWSSITGECVDVNACSSFPCTDTGAICADKLPPASNSPLGRTCTCGAGFTYANDTVGCVGTGTSYTATYSAATGANVSAPGTVDLSLPPGSLSSDGAAVKLLDTRVDAAVLELLPLANALYDLDTVSSHVATVLLPQQPLELVPVVLYSGSGNAWVLSGGAAVRPTDELRVAYLNQYTPSSPSPQGEQGLLSLEVLVEREEVELATDLTVLLPAWAFRPVGDGTFRADVVLSVSTTTFGARRRQRRMLLAGGSAGPKAGASPERGAAAAAAGVHSLGCSTNSRPGQECPAGWTPAKSLLAPTTPATTPARARAGAASKRAPSVVAGRGTPRVAAAVASAAAVSAAAVSSSSSSASYCAGTALLRPLPADFAVVVPFGPRADSLGVWTFHPGVDFAAPAGTAVVAAHDGSIEAAGTHATLGRYVVVKGSAGATLYAPLDGAVVAEGVAVAAGAALGAVAAGGWLHFAYVPEGDVFAISSSVDPVPCFTSAPPGGSTGGGSVTPNATLPTCDPAVQPPLPPNLANLDISIAPGSSKDTDVFLCTRPTTVAATEFDIALSVDLTGSFTDDLPIIKNLAPSLWSGLAAAIPSMRMALTVFWDYGSDPLVYDVPQDFTPIRDLWTGAVSAMVNGWGGDEPEADLIALKQMAAGLSWRTTAVRVVVLTTDAPFHTGQVLQVDNKLYQYGTLQEAIDIIKARGIKFVGICQPGCDPTQMQAFADATGGAVIMGASNSADIITAITNGISSLQYNIRAVVQPGCPLNITFSPSVVPNVGVAQVLTFRESIAVPAGFAAPVATCTVKYMADSGELASQVVTVHTGVTNGTTNTTNTTECRSVVLPSGVNVYKARCNRSSNIIAGGPIAQGATVRYFKDDVGYLPSSCPSLDSHCWVYVRDAAGREGWIPQGQPTLPRKFACGVAPGEQYIDCCAGGVPCSKRDLCVNKNCSGHGSCIEGACLCVSGWLGANCEMEDVCTTAAATNATVCSNHGFCDAGVCFCKPGFTGIRCETDICAGNPCNSHGVCSLGKCTCTAGWTGAACDVPDVCTDTFPCSGRGSCTPGSTTCVCVDGWTGADCSIPTCNTANCINGVCDSVTGFCNCYTYWSGADCSIPESCVDLNFCSGGGSCTADNTCECFSGYSGADCSTFDVCASETPPACVQGTCDSATGGCNCQPGWSGPLCDAADLCGGEFPCSGNGACNVAGECATCLEGWKGKACEIATGGPECRKVSRTAGLQLYSNRCNRTDLAVPGGLLAKGRVLDFYVDGGWRSSGCPGADKACWIYVYNKALNLEGWIQSDLPTQPQSGVCGAAPGVSYVQCCGSGYDCSAP